IGGTAAGAGNVISGNGIAGSGAGVAIDGTPGPHGGVGLFNRIQGNKIGTDVTGTRAVANSGSGVFFTNGAKTTLVGGSVTGAGNVISGNGHDGVAIYGTGTTNSTVQGNLIGTNAAGTAALPNGGVGVEVNFGATDAKIGGASAGAGNVISGN